MAKNYISYLENKGINLNEKRIKEIAQGSIFIAAKFREIDRYCPMIPKVLAADSKITE